VLILPPLCFWFDPVVFHEIESGIARPDHFMATVTYVGIGLSIFLFLTGRLAGERLPRRLRDMLCECKDLTFDRTDEAALREGLERLSGRCLDR